MIFRGPVGVVAMWSSMLSPWIFGHVRAHVIVYVGHVRAHFTINMMIRYHRHYYVGMIRYRPRLYDGMMWYHSGLWDGTIRYPPEIGVFSNSWEAVVELYEHLRSRTFGYGVSLGLCCPLITEGIAPILWGNLYTSAEFIKSIRIATSLEWADARMRYYD